MIKNIRKTITILIILSIILASIFAVITRADKTISKVDIVSNDGLSYISKQSIIDNIAKDGTKEWLNIDVKKIQSSLYKIKGVDYALVKKIWPSTIVIYLFDHKPIAYWNNNKILLDNMYLIKPEVFNYNGNLPYIESSSVDSRDYIFETYQNLEKIAKNNDTKIFKIIYKGNQFEVILSNDIDVMLGSKQLQSKFKEFFSNYKKVKNYKSAKFFDMRYADGFTVRYK